MVRPSLPLLLVFCSILLGACGGAPQGPRVHFASASPETLARAEREPVVWYEFQPGDVVPLRLLVLGVAESSADTPVYLRARKRFHLVMFQDGPPRFSFDGETIYQGEAGRAIIALGEHEGTNEAALILYLGRHEDMPEELR